jgi:Ni,Fe-hydrogenase I cytochrome b subunit
MLGFIVLFASLEIFIVILFVVITAFGLYVSSNRNGLLNLGRISNDRPLYITDACLFLISSHTKDILE